MCVVWTASNKPTASQARSDPVYLWRGNTDGRLDAKADTNAFTTCREMHVRVWAKGPSWIDVVLHGALVSTTPTRETVDWQRNGPWSRAEVGRFCATPCNSVIFDSTTVRMQARKRFMCPLMRSDKDKCIDRDTRSFTRSKNLDCIVDARWTSQLEWRCNQLGPPLCFHDVGCRSLVGVLTLRACSHAPLGNTRHISKLLQQMHRSAGLQLLRARQRMSCHNEELRNLHRFWSRPQLCDPRSGLEQLSTSKIGITNFSRSSGHETACSNSERARALRRLLQHTPEVQSIICRATSHGGLVERGSLEEENRCQVAPQRERLVQWRKAPWSRLMHALPKR